MHVLTERQIYLSATFPLGKLPQAACLQLIMSHSRPERTDVPQSPASALFPDDDNIDITGT